jgi:hypothetical protein
MVASLGNFPLTPESGRRTLTQMSRRPALAVVALLLATTVGGCDRGEHPSSSSIRPGWHQVTLPMPPGPAGRLAVRDATACGGRWYLVGAVAGDDEATRPVAWTSDDARTWRLMPLDPASFYARRAVLTSVACRDGRIAMVGSRSGGAHGNPRVTSWYQREDGTLVDMRATFELYGGPEAISVRRVAAGPYGWLIAGNRVSGAAVWVSADATDFRIVDDDPALRSDAEARTSALDQVWDGAGWTVVGRMETAGRVSPVPLAWTSSDGEHWARQQVPVGTDGFADLERVVDPDGGLVAVGLRGDGFGTWQRSGGTWEKGRAFGGFAADSTGARFVSGLVARSGNLVAAVSDGARYRLWTGTASAPWREVVAPARTPSSGDTRLTVAADDHIVLLLSDDGTTGRVWLADWPDFSN